MLKEIAPTKSAINRLFGEDDTVGSIWSTKVNDEVIDIFWVVSEKVVVIISVFEESFIVVLIMPVVSVLKKLKRLLVDACGVIEVIKVFDSLNVVSIIWVFLELKTDCTKLILSVEVDFKTNEVKRNEVLTK